MSVKELPFAPVGLPKSRWEGREEIVANTLANTGMFASAEATARSKGRSPAGAERS